MIKIFSTDMDGTLLDNNSQLPPNIETLISKINDQNKIFIAASGRTLTNLEFKFKDVDAEITFISDNGAILKHKGEIVYINRMDKKDVLDTIEMLKAAEDSTTVVITPEIAYIENDNKAHHEHLKEYYTHLTLVDDLRKYTDDVIKVTALSPTKSHENFNQVVKDNLSDRVYAVEAGKVWIDIMNRGVNKAEALQHIMNMYNIDKDEVVSFGDYFNDLEMIKFPKYGFVVANAPAEMKKQAYEVIDSNEELSVVKTIEYFLNKEATLSK